MVGRRRKISAEWMDKQDTLASSTEPHGWTKKLGGGAARPSLGDATIRGLNPL